MNKVSVIMTTFNSEEHLQTTLESVRKQDYPLIEIVICDGKSTDGTMDIIREYEKMPEMNIVWKSEKDNGIYDAMNKGYAMSSGDIIVFFNDIFSRKDAVRMCVEAIEREKSDGVHADLVYMDNAKIVRYWKMGYGNIKQGWMPGHPTLFLKRDVYEKYGLYKTDYRVSADYEFMIRILKDGKIKLAYLDETIVEMYYGGASTGGFAGYITSLKEGHRALKENQVKNAALIDIKRTLRVLKQFRR